MNHRLLPWPQLHQAFPSGWARIATLGLLAVGSSMPAAAMTMTKAAADHPGGWNHPAHLVALLAVALATVVMVKILRQPDGAWARWRGAATPSQQAFGVLTALLVIDLLLCAGFWLTRESSYESAGYLRAVFFVGGEGNLPAVYSGLQLLLAGWFAAQCALMSPRGDGGRMRWSRVTWTVAAIVCTYLALDEMLMLHEKITREAFGAGLLRTEAHNIVDIAGLQVRPWTLIFVPLALSIGGALAVMFHRILPTGRGLFGCLLAGGVVFLTGAVGVENLQAHQLSTGAFDRQETGYYLNLLLEEGMEMIGVTLATYVFAAVYFLRRRERLTARASTTGR